MKKYFYFLILIFAVGGCLNKSKRDVAQNLNENYEIQPPQASPKIKILEKFGDARLDPYYWLKDRENPEVIQHLTAENNYFQNYEKGIQNLENDFFLEMKSRIKEEDSSYPYFKSGYYYYRRTEKDQQYPIYCRKKGSLEAREEILADVNQMAKGHDYYQFIGPVMSPNQKLMAYGIDDQGRRFYNWYIKDLESNKLLKVEIPKITSNLIWAEDGETVLFAQQDPETLRSDRIFKLNIKSNKKTLVYEEKDATFNVGVYKSLMKKHIFISSSSTLTSEVLFLSADHPDEKPQVFLKRERGHEYGVIDTENGFYVLTNNQGAKNFKLMFAKEKDRSPAQWKEVIPHSEEVYLSGIENFKNYFVISYRKNGLTGLRIYNKKDLSYSDLQFQDGAYMVSLATNPNYDSDFVRYSYESPRQPDSLYDYSFEQKQSNLRKTREVPNFDSQKYKVERLWGVARDGVQVPITVVMKADYKKDSSAPLMVYGYGSYGYNLDPDFTSSIFSLVDRGFVYAVAHIRGGGELGRSWTDQGRTLKKKNTFYDFIDCTEYLVKKGYGDPKKVYAMGGSAGGLLMGVITNERPDLYNGIVAQVPFVDVLTTMLDDSIPLTTGEYDEWGNPNEKEFYDYIKTYSPYDNVVDKKYPNIFVSTGLHDSQVQYWEPAKWVQKLRDHNQNSTKIYLHTNMDAGHGGSSGRFDHLKEVARDYAFILDLSRR